MPGGNRHAVDRLDEPVPATADRVDASRGLKNSEFEAKWKQLEEKTGLQARKSLARPEGFEPPTPRSVVWCSVQLSYGRLSWII